MRDSSKLEGSSADLLPHPVWSVAMVETRCMPTGKVPQLSISLSMDMEDRNTVDNIRQIEFSSNHGHAVYDITSITFPANSYFLH